MLWTIKCPSLWYIFSIRKMRNFLLLSTLFFALGIFSAPLYSSAQELIKNNSFETVIGTRSDGKGHNFSDWVESPQTGRTDATSDAQSGARAIKITDGTSTNPVVRQAVTLAPLTSYILEWFGKTSAAGTLDTGISYTIGGDNYFLQDSADASTWNTTVNAILDALRIVSSPSWVKRTLSFTTPNFSGSYTFHFRSIGGNGTYGILDSVSLIKQSTAPVFSSVSVTNVTDSSVRVTWTTNIPASSQVEWGYTTDYGFRTSFDGTLSTSHTVTVTNLPPNVPLNLRAISKVGSGPEGKSTSQTFRTQRAYICGDGVCSTSKGENELVCGRDCRTANSCTKNLVGAYGVGTDPEGPPGPSSTARLAHELGVRFAMTRADDLGIDAENYDIGALMSVVRFIIKMQVRSNISATDRTIPVESVARGATPAELFSFRPLSLPAEFSIEWEEVRCAGFTNAPVSSFTDCERGINGTYAKSHTEKTVILPHKELEDFMRENANGGQIGYYAKDDSPHGPYMAASQKMYAIIKRFDNKPVFSGHGTGAVCNNNLRNNTGHGMFDGIATYIYPGSNAFDDDARCGHEDRTTATQFVLDQYQSLFQQKLGYMPPVIGIYQGFARGNDYLMPSLAQMKQQIDTYFTRGANAIGFFTIYRAREGHENPYNNSSIREMVREANKYAVQKFCPASSVVVPQILSPQAGQAVSTPVQLRFKPSGTFGSYKCEVKLNDTPKNVVSAQNNVVSEVNIATSETGNSAIIVRCWNGSAQNESRVSFQISGSTITPVISSISASSISSTTASINWTTNKPATSIIEYGTSVSYGKTISSSVLVNAHSLPLIGLLPNTLYHYRVKSRDASGNEAVSPNYTFQTLAGTTADTTPPQISDINAAVSTSSVTVTWTTNEFADSKAEYGLSAVYGFLVSSLTLTSSHSLVLPNLSPDTLYHYRVKSKDASGNESQSSNNTIRTVSDTPGSCTPSSINNGTVSPYPSCVYIREEGIRHRLLHNPRLPISMQ
ncbi:MAG: hypothetical protein HYW79_02985 [Parcubacteria group bacterium]|nr:hypothetical protein [Parcubacteria group bacterium]